MIRLVLALAASFCLAAPANPRPAPARKAVELAGEPVEFPTRDGWTLNGKYLAAKEEQPTFVLLHDRGGRHQDWHPLARLMARAGIGYLAIDLRGHSLSRRPPEGQPAMAGKFTVSKSYNEWENMREDVVAAVEFLKGRGVPEDRVALGGGDVGGSIAVKYAAVHPEVPMVFLLSPGMAYKEVLTVNAMRAYKNRPVLMVVAEDDALSMRETAILFGFAKMAAGEENVRLLRLPKRHGTRMLWDNRGLAAEILAWIADPVQFQLDLSSGAVLGEGELPSERELDGIVSPGDAIQ